jgi:S1-C subfamily serine protease
VAAVSEGSDAEKQGIRVGDVITAVDGQNVTTTEEVVSIKDAHQVGDTLTFSVWRPEGSLEISVTLMDTNDIYG